MELKGGKHLTFHLGKEEFGIPINSVREIIGILDITPIPKSPEYVHGVINLRGKIVPVIDLRLRLGMNCVDYTEKACTIVVETIHSDEKKLTGIIVDSVSEVVNISQNELEILPVKSAEDKSCFGGLGKVKNNVILLIDVEEIIVKENLEVQE